MNAARIAVMVSEHMAKKSMSFQRIAEVLSEFKFSR
jgi:hypothetical protein